jgi:hypothetical protein
MKKQFTVEQANRTLPLVRRITEDLVHAYERWHETVNELEVHAAAARADVRDARREALERRIQELAAEVEGYEAELQQVGGVCKDHRLGLIDFPGEVAGRSVELCWRLGEPAVQHWHEYGAGYTARHSLGPRRSPDAPSESWPTH